jgi:hypothetical protein
MRLSGYAGWMRLSGYAGWMRLSGYAGWMLSGRWTAVRPDFSLRTRY